MVCMGNGLEYCGGPARLNMYTQPAASISTTSTTTTSPTPTGGPSVVPSVGSFSSVGCYTEATTGRALTGNSYANNSMTVESCAAFCSPFIWFGVEYARECKFLWFRWFFYVMLMWDFRLLWKYCQCWKCTNIFWMHHGLHGKRA